MVRGGEVVRGGRVVLVGVWGGGVVFGGRGVPCTFSALSKGRLTGLFKARFINFGR